MKGDRVPGWALWSLALLLAVAGFVVLGDYNVSWDEALGDFFFGQRYLSFFTTFDAAYLDFDSDPYAAGHRPDLSMSPFRVRPWEYYGVSNTLAAATSAVLSGLLGWVDPFDGFHAVNLWLGLLFVVLFVRLSEREVGAFGALLAVALLFSSPRIVCHALANTKDFPELVFFSVTLLLFHRSFEQGSIGGIVAAGALSGVALGAKANALFLLPILLVYVLVGGLPKGWRERRSSLAGALLAAAAAGVTVFVASWPYLWAAPIERALRHFDYIRGQVGQVRAESLLSPLGALVGTTPLPLLALAVIGLVPLAVRLRRRDRFAILLLSWIVVVLGRLYLPGAVNFDGVRHFLELFPALVLLGAIGAEWILRRVSALVGSDRGWALASPRRLALALLVVSAVPGAWATVHSHPFQIAYWNALVGGVEGAHRRQIPQAGDYWGLSYRQGLEWVNENLPEGAVLAVPVVEHAVRLVAQSRLRSDVGLAQVSLPTRPEISAATVDQLRQLGRERPLYVMFVPRADWSNRLMLDCLTRLRPLREWRLDGVPLLMIYRYPGEEEAR